MADIFSPTDQNVFFVLFLASIFYAVILELWFRQWPESFDDLTWLTVVIGVGYVLLALLYLIPLEEWLKVAAAFFAASLPIIARSVINVSRRRREANHELEQNTNGDA